MTHDLQEKLIQAAIKAAEKAYVPYSHYYVGAALYTPDGQIYTGCNVENAAYPMCICAERTALVKAVSEGHRHFETLIVATKDGGSPCGMCRQMLYEFSPELQVYIVDFSGKVHITVKLNELLTHGFNASSLE